MGNCIALSSYRHKEGAFRFFIVISLFSSLTLFFSYPYSPQLSLSPISPSSFLPVSSAIPLCSLSPHHSPNSIDCFHHVRVNKVARLQGFVEVSELCCVM
jgi:hypothetical protein